MDESFLVASVVLYGIWVKPLFILFCISLCLARRKRDPARNGFAWMKAVFPVWVLALILTAVARAVQLWWELVQEQLSLSSLIDVSYASSQLFTVGLFIKFLADALLLITLSELGSGFLLCVTGKPLAKPIRFGVMSTAAFLSILSIAYLGLNAKANSSAYELSSGVRSASDDDILQVDRDYRNALRMQGAVNVLFWIASMPLLGLISFVVHKVRPAKHLHNSVGLLLTCAILNFIRMTTELGFAAAYYLSDIPALYEPYTDTIIIPVLDIMPMFVILVMLFTIGVRKKKGLWSTALPPPAAAPYGAPVWQGPPPPPGQMFYGAPPPMQGAAPAYGYPVQPHQYGTYPQQQPMPPQGQPPQGYPAQLPPQGVPQQDQPGQLR